MVAFVNWLIAQLRRPSHTSRSVLAAVSALGSLLKAPPVRQLFTRSGATLISRPTKGRYGRRAV